MVANSFSKETNFIRKANLHTSLHIHNNLYVFLSPSPWLVQEFPSQYSKGLVNNSNRTHFQKDQFPPHMGNTESAILGVLTAQLAAADYARC